jgi:hypothetical protein
MSQSTELRSLHQLDRGTDVKRHVKWSRDLSRDGFLGATNQELVGR